MKKGRWTWALWITTMFSLGAGSVLLMTTMGQVRVPKPMGSLEPSLLSASLDNQAVHVGRDDGYNLAQHQNLSRVIWLIRENYVDPARVKPDEMFMEALQAIQKAVPEVLIDTHSHPDTIEVTVDRESQSFKLGKLDQLWEITMALRDVFRFLQQHIEDPEERRNIEYAAINGMLSTLDPHSILLKPENFEDVRMSTKGEFGGLGIVISIRDNTLTVMSPIEGTPAARAGIKAMDKIVRIGDESTINMGLDEAVDLLRGRAGTQVVIWLQRKSWKEARKFKLTRAKIKIESVTSKLLDDDIGYIRIKNFQGNTYEDLDQHLSKLQAQAESEQKKKGTAFAEGMKGLILDLRNNPGGLLDQAIMVSDRFIERGPLVVTVGESARKREVKNARRAGTDTRYPIAVLVNGGSASASEIVSGALKNHHRAVVIGQQTFGKGSVQVLYNFKDQSALKLTIAQYLTPGDVSIQSVGITPDVEILPATLTKESIHLFSETLGPREKDLDKHLEHVSASGHQKATQRLVYYVSEDELEEMENTVEGFKQDFEIDVAHKMLSQTPHKERQQMLGAAENLFNTLNQEQDKRIVEQFKKLGVDWKAGGHAGIDPTKFETRLNSDLGEDPSVTAGNKLTLKATVTNQSNQPAYRVFGVTKSENPLLNHLEFAFGYIPPNSSKSWETTIKVPKEMSALGSSVTLQISSADNALKLSSTPMLVAMSPVNKPNLRYNAWINDNAGNKDGTLQVGEKVQLIVHVENTSEHEAEDVLVSLKNLSKDAVLLGKGRERLGKLGAGKSKQANLVLTVQRPVEDISLKLAVGDSSLGTGFANKISYPVLPKRSSKKEVRTLQSIRNEAVPIYSGASTRMPILGYAQARSLLSSDRWIGGWRRVRVGKQRVGFIQEKECTPSQQKAGAKSRAIEFTKGQSAPELSIQHQVLVTSAPTYRIQGFVKDDHALRDLLVFVNERKVHYQSLKGIDTRASYPIDLPITLDEGHNQIAVIVRENEDLVSREVLGIYRKATTAMAEKGVRNSANNLQ